MRCKAKGCRGAWSALAPLLIGLWLAAGDAWPAPPPASGTGRPARREARSVPAEERAAADDLFALYHVQWVTGDLARARAGLQRLVDDAEAPLQVRGEAVLRLAQIEELSGDRNLAVRYLMRCEAIVGADDPLAARAAEAHRRIRSAVPLADVPGPAPGSVALTPETANVGKMFKTAERRLVAFYRVIVAPRLDNVDAVLRAKRRALQAALQAFARVVESGGPLARSAAHFRMGAMCHHFAEAAAFDQPAGLLPEVAERLARAMRSESAAYLRRALGHYHAVLAVKDGVGISDWHRLARREANTLGRVLSKGSQKR